MNVLNRKMFANGGAAQAEPSIPDLIGYYVSQGYNALEIKEMLPDLAMGDIEAVVSQLGGSINSAVASPGANEFEGNFNVFPQIPETTVTANKDGMTTMNPSFPEGATPPELPNLDDISIVPPELQEFLAATAQFGKDQQLIMLTSPNYSFNLSEEEARQILNMPSIDIDMIPPQMPSDLPMVEEVGNIVGTVNKASDLGPNQYRTSAGIVHTIDPTKFAEDLNQENDRILSGILSNPNAEYGSNLASIVESAALKRSSSLVPEEDIKVGQNIMLNPSAEIQTAGKYAVDLFKDTGEGIANAFRSVISPEMVGIFRGREAEEAARLAGRGEDLDLFSTPDSFNPMDYGSTGGERPETLDQIVLSSSLGEDITKSLEDIAADDVKTAEQKEEEVVATATDDKTATDDDTAKEDKTITGTSTNPEKTIEPGEDSKEDKSDSIIIAANENDQAEQLSQSLGFFQQPDTQRLIRNIGKGLTQYGNFAEGIGKGSAAAAEERVLQEQLDAKREAELAKLQADSKMTVGENEKVLNSKTKLNDYIKEYNNAIAAEELTTSILGILSNPSENITSFRNKIGVSIDEFLNAAELKDLSDFETMKPGQRAKAMLKVLTNRDIKEILGESGRTISNIDRQIAEKIMGSLQLFTIEDSVGTMKFKLEENLRSITTKKSLAQRNIKANSSFIAEYDPKSIFDDIELLYILNKELGYNLPRQTSESRPSPDSDAIFIDDTAK